MRLTTRRGFTLIEIMVVMIVLGILAAIAFVRVQSSKHKAVVATMVSDLHAIAQEQEGHFIESHSYTTDQVVLNAVSSPGNTLTIPEGTASGWSGQVSNPNVTRTCTIFVGDATPLAASAAEGAIVCQ